MARSAPQDVWSSLKCCNMVYKLLSGPGEVLPGERESRVHFSQGEYLIIAFILVPRKIHGILLLGFQILTDSQRLRGTARDSSKSLRHSVGHWPAICNFNSIDLKGGCGATRKLQSYGQDSKPRTFVSCHSVLRERRTMNGEGHSFGHGGHLSGMCKSYPVEGGWILSILTVRPATHCHRMPTLFRPNGRGERVTFLLVRGMEGSPDRRGTAEKYCTALSKSEKYATS